MFLCIFVGICMVLHLDFGILYVSESRGIKPPPDCMWFAAMAFYNIWKKSKGKSIIDTLIFIIPPIMFLKMTYTITIVLIFAFVILMKKGLGLATKIFMGVGLFVSISMFLYMNSDFNERMTGMIAETNDIAQNESGGNFSYRIVHAKERYDFISKDPIMLCRGFGYLHEKNLKQQLFVFGTNNGEGQLDTGDIVWSLFFIRLGIVGIFFYLIMYLNILRKYYRNRNNAICCVFAAMLISYLIFTSLGNAIISYGYFFIYPILFLNICKKQSIANSPI